MKGSPMKRNFPEAFENNEMDLKSQVVNKAVDELMNEDTPMMNKEDVYKKADALYEAADKAHEKAMKIGDEPHM